MDYCNKFLLQDYEISGLQLLLCEVLLEVQNEREPHLSFDDGGYERLR